MNSNIHQVADGQNNCDPGANCALQLDNTVKITATGASEVNADIDVSLNGQNNCDPTATCILKLERTVNIIATDGEVVNANYQENVNYVQECGAGLTCVHEDCTNNNMYSNRLCTRPNIKFGTRISKCY